MSRPARASTDTWRRSSSFKSGTEYASAEQSAEDQGLRPVDSHEELNVLGDGMDSRARAAIEMARAHSSEMGGHCIGFPDATPEHGPITGKVGEPASMAPQDGATDASIKGDDVSRRLSLVPPSNRMEVLEPVPDNQRLQLNFDNVSAWVPNIFAKKPGPIRTAMRLPGRIRHSEAAEAQKKEGKRQVLFEISGAVRPGEILALLGPSGSGKTTLLTVVGGRTPRRVLVEGSIKVAGQPLSKALRRQIGFVLQDDVMYESLTVHETLMYAGLLRLPAATPRAAKLQRVDQVIDVLGLRGSANTIIGGYLRRGVSGGERKRVSIGHELLINPAVLMLDEPTSGLDATTAHHLLLLLRGLAAGGRAVLTTIHQPSSRLYLQLDRLMLLAEGHLMYYGDTQAAGAWFEHFGYRLPYRINEADFLLDIAMGEAAQEGGAGDGTANGSTHPGNGHMGGGEAAVRELYRSFEAWVAKCPLGVTHAVVEALSGTRHGKMGVEAASLPRDDGDGPHKPLGLGAISPSLCAADIESGRLTHPSAEATEKVAKMARGPRQGASYPTQVAVLTMRALKVRRFESLTGQNLVQLVCVALITGLVWFQRARNDSLAAAQDTLGLLFFQLLFPSFRSLFSALFTFPNEFRMLVKERPSGMYRLSAYYAARTLADLPVEIVYPSIFVVLIYFLGGLRLAAWALFANWSSLLLVVLLAQSWGLLIGGAFMDPKTAQTVTTVVMLSFMLVGGFYVSGIPVWIAWIKYLSFIYWGFNLLLKIEFGGRGLRRCPGDGGPCVVEHNLQSALGMPTNPNAAAWPEVLVLLAMLIALRTLTYYVLRRKTAATSL